MLVPANMKQEQIQNIVYVRNFIDQVLEKNRIEKKKNSQSGNSDIQHIVFNLEKCSEDQFKELLDKYRYVILLKDNP